MSTRVPPYPYQSPTDRPTDRFDADDTRCESSLAKPPDANHTKTRTLCQRTNDVAVVVSAADEAAD